MDNDEITREIVQITTTQKTQYQELERLEQELKDDLAKIEARSDELYEFVWGGPDGRSPLEDRMLRLEAFQREIKAILFSTPGEDNGLIDRVKNRRIVAIAFVISTLFTVATAINGFWGEEIKRYFRTQKSDPVEQIIEKTKHPHKVHYRVRIIEAPEEEGQEWR